MAPAIRLARDGFRSDSRRYRHPLARGALLRQQPAVARIFLRPDGSSFEPGDRLTQSDLADTLSAIAANGPDAFYKGRIAAAVARDSGGALTEADFAAYHVTEAKPVACGYRGRVMLVGAAAILRRHDAVRNSRYPGSVRHARALGFHSARLGPS